MHYMSISKSAISNVELAQGIPPAYEDFFRYFVYVNTHDEFGVNEALSNYRKWLRERFMQNR